MTESLTVSVAHSGRFTSCSRFICFSLSPFLGLGRRLLDSWYPYGRDGVSSSCSRQLGFHGPKRVICPSPPGEGLTRSLLAKMAGSPPTLPALAVRRTGSLLWGNIEQIVGANMVDPLFLLHPEKTSLCRALSHLGGWVGGGAGERRCQPALCSAWGPGASLLQAPQTLPSPLLAPGAWRPSGPWAPARWLPGAWHPGPSPDGCSPLLRCCSLSLPSSYQPIIPLSPSRGCTRPHMRPMTTHTSWVGSLPSVLHSAVRGCVCRDVVLSGGGGCLRHLSLSRLGEVPLASTA